MAENAESVYGDYQDSRAAGYQRLYEHAARLEQEDRLHKNRHEPKTTRTKKGTREGKVRIHNMMAVLLIGAAFLFDAGQALLTFLMMAFTPIFGIGPFVFGPILEIYPILPLTIFGIWFLLLKVNYFTGRQAALKVVGLFCMLIFGFIPVFSAFPEITGGVIVLIIATRIEDTVGDRKQLTRIADRRTRNRDRLMGRHSQALERTRREADKRRQQSTQRGGNKTRANQRYDKRIGAQQKKNVKELKQYDRGVGRENLGMLTRVALGTPNRPVDGITARERNQQRALPGYQDRQAAYYEDQPAETIYEDEGEELTEQS